MQSDFVPSRFDCGFSTLYDAGLNGRIIPIHLKSLRLASIFLVALDRQDGAYIQQFGSNLRPASSLEFSPKWTLSEWLKIRSAVLPIDDFPDIAMSYSPAYDAFAEWVCNRIAKFL